MNIVNEIQWPDWQRDGRTVRSIQQGNDKQHQAHTQVAANGQNQQQSARLSTLNAIGTAAVSSLELRTVMGRVLELTCQSLKAPAGSVMVKEPGTGDLRIFALNLADERATLGDRRLPSGRGIAGWVVQHGESARVNDVRQDGRWYKGIDTVTGFETRSLLCAPLRHHGKVTGVIEVIGSSPDAFSDTDLGLLEAVASIAASALENARLYATTRSYAERMALLHRIARSLVSTLDRSTVIQTALSEVQRLFAAQSVSFLQLDPQTGELLFAYALVEGQQVAMPIHLQPGEGIAGWALQHSESVLVQDAQTDPRFSKRVDRAVGSHTRALMAVPLKTPERDVGVVEVVSGEPGTYTDTELDTFRAIAATLTVALENARLYDELKALLAEREEAQAQLIHVEKMSALGRLLASIGHEISNPLQAVQTFVTLAQEEIGGGQHSEKMERYLRTIGDEIERIATIVHRMRDFYRPARAGRQATNLHTVLESVLALTSKQFQHGKVTIEREWAGSLPEIQANPDHLKQVFLNLALNAVDSMPAGGTLRICTVVDQTQFSKGQPPRPAVRVEFSDTGQGMTQEVLSHLFEPFFTTKEHGSGLGLSISYGIIRSHGGHIAVESHVGLGTTFTILLPIESL